MIAERCDVLVIGSGPAGQKAAICAAKTGRDVIIVEREAAVGGECVHRGTIPSKTLRETALALTSFRRRAGHAIDVTIPESTQIASILARLDEVVVAHERVIEDQLLRNEVRWWRGRARFASPREIDVTGIHGDVRRIEAELVVIASGSKPRAPQEIPIDHEHILDSDSILSIVYLPRSLTVLGGGVIASEYASIFAALGVKVTMVDRADRPLSFLDPEISLRFLEAFERAGGRFIGKARARAARFDGLTSVVTELDTGEDVVSEKLLCALGRVANVDGLGLENAGLALDARGLVPCDENCRTAVPHVLAVGDVVGPPSLAAAAMEQGRRAMCHALGLPAGPPPELSPIGVYTIPEIASVGLTEAQAIEKHGAAVVGRARFDELARGQIAGAKDGMLKLVCDRAGRRVLGVQIIGESAADLVHTGQMAILAKFEVDVFVENTFNFPTLAEAYRVAALDVVGKRARAEARDAGPRSSKRRVA